MTADAAEHELLERFIAHPVLREIETIGDDAFLAILPRRRFLSLMFR